MEHEIRFYLKQIKAAMEYTDADIAAMEHNDECEDMPYKEVRTLLKPQYLITATRLPTGAIEIAVNNRDIEEKINYILEYYDDEMHLRGATGVVMENIMVV